MKYSPDVHRRRSMRLQGYDYAQAGAYFITICTKDRQCLFGNIMNGKMEFNEAGKMLERVWSELPIRFDIMELDEFTVMPNHFHGIVTLSCRGEACLRPYGTRPDSIGRVVQAFKSITTHQYINGVRCSGWCPFPGKLWQRNYWDHIIQDEAELITIRKYITNNPSLWESDQLNPACA